MDKGITFVMVRARKTQSCAVSFVMIMTTLILVTVSWVMLNVSLRDSAFANLHCSVRTYLAPTDVVQGTFGKKLVCPVLTMKLVFF